MLKRVFILSGAAIAIFLLFFLDIEAQGFRRDRSRPSVERPSRTTRQAPERRQKSSIQTELDSFHKDRPIRRADQKEIERGDRGNQTREQFAKENRKHKNWFNEDFWKKHHSKHHHPHNNWWKVATAAGIGYWLGWQSTPVYYNYSYSGDTYYRNTPYGSAPIASYDSQASIIDSQNQVSADEEWMPLGVFALTSQDNGKKTPNIYIQLAVSKDGSIAGTYYNARTNKAEDAEGLVDRASQMAAWKIVDAQDSPIMETGIFNLTQSEAPVLIHFKDGTIKEKLLVRLNDPNKQP